MPPITTSGATVIVMIMIDITISFCFCCNRFMCQEIGKRTLKRIWNSSRMLQYLQCWRLITTVSCHTLGSVFKFYAVHDTFVSEYKIQFQPGNHQLSLFGAPSKECIQSYDQYLGGNGQISNKFYQILVKFQDASRHVQKHNLSGNLCLFGKQYQQHLLWGTKCEASILSAAPDELNQNCDLSFIEIVNMNKYHPPALPHHLLPVKKKGLQLQLLISVGCNKLFILGAESDEFESEPSKDFINQASSIGHKANRAPARENSTKIHRHAHIAEG